MKFDHVGIILFVVIDPATLYRSRFILRRHVLHNVNAFLVYQIKVWELPEGGEMDNVSTPLLSLPSQQRRVENVLFHPAADNVLAVSVGKTVKIFDISNGAELIGEKAKSWTQSLESMLFHLV